VIPDAIVETVAILWDCTRNQFFQVCPFEAAINLERDELGFAGRRRQFKQRFDAEK
jgi:hypothetical protein